MNMHMIEREQCMQFLVDCKALIEIFVHGVDEMTMLCKYLFNGKEQF